MNYSTHSFSSKLIKEIENNIITEEKIIFNPKVVTDYYEYKYRIGRIEAMHKILNIVIEGEDD